MKTRYLLPLILFFLPAVSLAGTLDDVKIALHWAAPVTAKNACESMIQPACDSPSVQSAMQISAPLAEDGSVFVVLVDISPTAGVQSVEFALDFDGAASSGVDITSYIPCSDTVFPAAGWPTDPESAVTFTWNTCQNTVDPLDPQGEAWTVVCVLQAHGFSEDMLRVMPKPLGTTDAVDCSSNITDLWQNHLDNMGRMGFGGPGWDPCVGGLPIEEETWSGIKALFLD